MSPADARTSPLLLRESAALDLAAVNEVVKVAREDAARCDADAAFPTGVLETLRATRLLGLPVPAAHGGPGGSFEDVLAVGHAIARECTSAAMIFVMHCQQAAALVDYGTPELRRTLLPRIARGEVYLASVTTEPGSGGHLLSADAAVGHAGGVLTIDRTAPIVTGGEHADGYLVSMRAGEDEGGHRVSLVYADAADVRADAVAGWDPLGMRGTRSVPMKIKGTVPAANLVGEAGEFREIVTRSFGPQAHLGWAACWLGAAAGALGRTIALLRSPAERKRRDLSSDLLRHRLSQVRQRLDTVHAMIAHGTAVYRSAAPAALAEQHPQLLFNAVKLTASEQCPAAVDELIEIVGMRHGYLKNSELGLERVLRDLRSASLNYGNDRLHAADGALALLDGEVRFA